MNQSGKDKKSASCPFTGEGSKGEIRIKTVGKTLTWRTILFKGLGSLRLSPLRKSYRGGARSGRSKAGNSKNSCRRKGRRRTTKCLMNSEIWKILKAASRRATWTFKVSERNYPIEELDLLMSYLRGSSFSKQSSK